MDIPFRSQRLSVTSHIVSYLIAITGSSPSLTF